MRWKKNKLRELRPLSNDTLVAILILKSNQAGGIMEECFLWVVPVKCRIEKILNIQKFQRCWSHDHYTDKCGWPDHSKNCFKCRMSEHSSKDFKNDEACSLYNEIWTQWSVRSQSSSEPGQTEGQNKTPFIFYGENKTDITKVSATQNLDDILMDEDIEFDKMHGEACATAKALGKASSLIQI